MADDADPKAASESPSDDDGGGAMAQDDIEAKRMRSTVQAAWFGGPETRRSTREGLVRFVESVVADGTPRSRIVIAGFSQGAAAAADVAAAMGDLRGVAILSGDHSTREPLSGRIFVSHGRSDAVLGFAGAERRARSYADHADVRFVPFDGGHTLRPIEPAFVHWLNEVFATAP